MDPIITPTTATIGAVAWFGNKLLGPTAEIIGQDLKKLYEKGIDKIVANAIKKTKNIDSNDRTNLRVTRDVLWNGSFTDESICAEYFGGVLASSRSEDGKDDFGVFYVNIIKSLSSSQLKVHYAIYRALNKILVTNEEKKTLNPGQGRELQKEKLFFAPAGIVEEYLDMGPIFFGLNSMDLISAPRVDNHETELGNIVYVGVTPTALGVQLFAIANNMLSDWLKFSTVDFGGFEDAILPKYYSQSLDGLSEKIVKGEPKNIKQV